MPTRTVLARFLVTPENRPALLALQDLLVGLNTKSNAPNPLFIHGPSGCGKTHLVRALVEELATLGVGVCQMSGNDFANGDKLEHAREAAVLIIEDLQHLPTRFVNPLIELIDSRLNARNPLVFTALQGPGRLKHRGTAYANRLTSRLASGLVVAMQPLQGPARRRLLKALAEEAKLTVAADVLSWLAEHLTGGGRQLEGAIRQLKTLQRLQAKPLTLAEVQSHLRVQVDERTPTVKRIAEHVSGYFQVEPKHVTSARRSREVLLTRQVSMYLARQLTDLSLQKIGKYFGNRDHKTVQHACRKVESAMKSDAALSGAVRQMHAELA